MDVAFILRIMSRVEKQKEMNKQQKIKQLTQELIDLKKEQSDDNTQFIKTVKKRLSKEIKDIKVYIKNGINIEITATVNYKLQDLRVDFSENKAHHVSGLANVKSNNENFESLSIFVMDDHIGNIITNISNFMDLHPKTKLFVTEVNKMVKDILNKAEKIAREMGYKNLGDSSCNINDLLFPL